MKRETKQFSRRDFIKGAAAGAASLAAMGIMGACQNGDGKAATATALTSEKATDAEQSSVSMTNVNQGDYTFSDTIKWDGQYDVIVVGFGGAGANTAITAADAGASVLLIDSAPEGHEGGNTRYCAQLFMTITDYDEGLAYYQAMRGDFLTPSDEMLEVYVKGMMEIKDYLVDTMGADASAMTSFIDGRLGRQLSVEYPELPGTGGLDTYTINGKNSDSALWNLYKENVKKRMDKIDVWFESPAQHLIQDPASKTIMGLQIERHGETVNILAKNGVVLTCGGFEANQQMVQDYLGYSDVAATGTTYNVGTGINMAMEVGAKMWHMNTYEASGIIPGLYSPASLSSSYSMTLTYVSAGAFMLVGDDGTRYMNECAAGMHGHTYLSGSVHMQSHPDNPYIILDQTKLLCGPVLPSFSSDNSAEIESGILIKADTMEELAELLGMEKLVSQAEHYNFFCEQEIDYQHGRAKDLIAFDNGPYYALKMCRGMINTQGGPERSPNAEVLDLNGVPLPHLYSAGEIGGITSNLYNGGGNMAECIVFGRIAGTNAAAEKADLEFYQPLQPVEGNLVYVPGYENDLTSLNLEEIPLESNQRLGTGTGMGGEVVVKVTFDGDTITDIEIIKQTETEGIGDVALEELAQRIVEANSTEVDTVSGATTSSRALIAAVEDARAQLN